MPALVNLGFVCQSSRSKPPTSLNVHMMAKNQELIFEQIASGWHKVIFHFV